MTASATHQRAARTTTDIRSDTQGEPVNTTRRTHRTVRACGLAAVATAAALSLTACQGDGTESGAAGSSSSAAATDDSAEQRPEPTGTQDSGPTGADSTSGGGSGNSDGAGTHSRAATPRTKRSACTVGKVSVNLQRTGGTAAVVLLKATNNGSTRCDLYGYPFVGYPGAQAPIAVGGGKPQAVVSLEPGESGYAALGLEKGDGPGTHREKQITVELADRSLHGTGSTAKVSAPGGAGLALGDSSTVSYWNTTPELALQ
ncbi:DUF4232 domain-containing protein [Streptomyces qinglanensis]|uniref:DUF4232 domain-containing protein n=1 Tax=Streptomyces qinglanensis TaxID=943816 RepID=UPI003D7424A6